MSIFTSESTREQSIRVHVKVLEIPPIKDGLLLGKTAAIGFEAMKRTLELVNHDKFETITFSNDDILSHAFVRVAVLKKVPRAKLEEFFVRRLKPIMTENEILLLDIDVELVIEDKL